MHGGVTAGTSARRGRGLGATIPAWKVAADRKAAQEAIDAKDRSVTGGDATRNSSSSTPTQSEQGVDEEGTAPAQFLQGNRVTIFGLTSAAGKQLNGLEGDVARFDATVGRYVVQVGNGGKLINSFLWREALFLKLTAL